MRHMLLSAAALFAAVHLPCAAWAQADEIWFDSPASFSGAAAWALPHSGTANPDPEWESSSLPLGNGFMGANVMGSVCTERVTLNEKTLWRGGPGVPGGAAYYWDVNRQSQGALGQIRHAFARGDNGAADSLTRHFFSGLASYEASEESPFRFGSFTTLGEVTVDTGIPAGPVPDYRKSLSLDDAVASVSFRSGGAYYRREFFISYPDRVMVMRFTSDTLQDLALRYTPNPESRVRVLNDGKDGVLYEGKLDSNGMEFAVRLSVIADGGAVSVHDDGSLAVTGAGEAVFILAAATDYRMNFDPDFADPAAYRGEDPSDVTAGFMDKARRLGYGRLLSRHMEDYRELYGRVVLDLAPGAEDPYDSLPAPERLARYREGNPDPGLESMYFQFGRYLLISSSRPGSMPANLQGIWHNGVDGPWHVDYHNNINIQMNYWPALVTGLRECCVPLTDYIRTLEKPGRRVAQSYFGAGGWTASISSNIFGFASPLSSRDMSWNLIPVAGPWLATHLWEYYMFTQDRGWLEKTGYPLIRGSAEFLTGYLWRSPGGEYMACPSTSPEHGPVDKGTAFANSVARELLEDAAAAASVLGCDPVESGRWAAIADSIAPLRTGRYGQLMEWSSDIDDPEDRHRHVNHLFGLHPGRFISPVTTPQLAAASKVVLEHRGDLATGWSMAWKLNQWTRLHDGDHAYRLLRTLLSEGTTDNLWCIHPPFQIDGNFGGCAGMAEMLLQSHMGFIHLLPALPSAWKSGRICGLRARGGFVLSLGWEDGRLAWCEIYSASGNPCTVYYDGQSLCIPAGKGKTFRIVPGEGKGLTME